MIDDQPGMAGVGMLDDVGKRFAHDVVGLYFVFQRQVKVGNANGAIQHDVVLLAEFFHQCL